MLFILNFQSLKVMKPRKGKFVKVLYNALSLCILVLLMLMVFSGYKLVEQAHYIRKPVLNHKAVKNNSRNLDYNSTKVEYLINTGRFSINHLKDLKDDVTVVTAYFDLGPFKKGDEFYFTPALYRKWMAIFKYLENPVIAYFDSVEHCNYFKVLRHHIPPNRTRVIHVERKDLWAFQIQDKIDEIFKQPGYPKYSPNTIFSEYSSAMHAKYELMKRSTIENVLKTRYIAWLDVGLFREISNKNKLHSFGLYLPKNILKSAIGYTEVYSRKTDLTSVDIIYSNAVWVCGCFFIGPVNLMLRWTIEYMEGVDWLLRKNIMNTDQQVIYALMNAGVIKTHIQTYRSDGTYNPWFHLGYAARDVWLDRQMKFKIVNALTS